MRIIERAEFRLQMTTAREIREEIEVQQIPGFFYHCGNLKRGDQPSSNLKNGVPLDSERGSRLHNQSTLATKAQDRAVDFNSDLDFHLPARNFSRHFQLQF